MVEILKSTEKSKSENQISRRGIRAALTESLPCDLSHEALLGYTLALQLGHNCYIAAELSAHDIRQEIRFPVGDNGTYGGYYNAPLEKGKEYDVWFGLKVQVDGITVASYTKTPVPVSRESTFNFLFCSLIMIVIFFYISSK